jgi:hypothetical protein
MRGLMCRSPILSEKCIRRDLSGHYLYLMFGFSRIALCGGYTWRKVNSVSCSVMLFLQKLGCKGISYQQCSFYKVIPKEGNN